MTSKHYLYYLNHKICFQVFGKKSNRKTLIYFHGLPGSRLEAALLEQAAQKRDMWVIAVDRPGCGESEYLPRRSPQDFSPIVAAVAAHLEIDSCELLALSGGGPYALAAACDLPNLVKAVTLIASPAPFTALSTTSGMLSVNRVFLEIVRYSHFGGVSLVRTLAWFIRRYPALGLLGLRHSSASDRRALSNERIPSMMMDNFRESVSGDFKGLHDEARILLSDWPFMEKIMVPCRIYHGSADSIVPFSASMKLKERLSNAHVDLEIIPEEGHLLAVHNLSRILDGIFVD